MTNPNRTRWRVPPTPKASRGPRTEIRANAQKWVPSWARDEENWWDDQAWAAPAETRQTPGMSEYLTDRYGNNPNRSK